MKGLGKKKGVALLLCVSMLSGMSLSAVDSIKTNAAEKTTAPSVTAFASKDDLENKFAPDSGNIGKLKFGKDNQEWYILGIDSGVNSGKDNTVIFAASNMVEDGQVFNSDRNEKSYDKNSMGTYIPEAEITNVYPNHYGASDLRKKLQSLATNSNCFTKAEQALMNETPVKTEDYKNKDGESPRYYTTSDKLYAPGGDLTFSDTQNIYVGSQNSKLSQSTYWGDTGNWFWLRSPISFYYDFSLYARPGHSVDGSYVDYGNDYGLRPASNLDLSSVLFASSAVVATSDEAAAGSITAETAMSLRLDGKDKNIGSVKASGDAITVTRGSTSQTVALVVQGKDPSGEEKDWYYSEVIPTDGTTPKTVEASTIKTTVGLADEVDIDLEACKIWLEITDTDGMIYAVDSSYVSHEHTWSDKLTPYNSEQHGYECTDENCPDKGTAAGFKDLADHEYDKDNVCTECGYRLGDHIVHKVEKDPTRTEPGYKPHFECTECDKWFEYPAINGVLVEITDKSAYIIPKKTSGGGGSGGSSNTNTGWIKDSKGWRFRNSDGTLAQGTTVTDADGNKVEKVLWQKAGNGYYAFGSDGYLVTGWIYDKLEDKWYYCDENVGKLYGWFNEPQDGYWYYLSPSTGEALTGWHSINGKDYYFAAAPSAPTYSFDASTGFWIYSNLNGNRPFGSMYANTVTPDNYQVDANGAWIH